MTHLTSRVHRIPTLLALVTLSLPAVAMAAPPTSPEAAAKVLDLRNFPVLEGAKLYGGKATLGRLMYEAKATPADAFAFQKKELLKRGFTELKGTYTSAETNVGHFAKDGFTVAASASKGYGEDKVGLASVTLVNDGNVDLQQLPKPPGVQPFHSTPLEASHTTELSVPDAIAACRKLLLAAGWEPYGEAPASPNQPDSLHQWFKQNGIRLQCWVMKAAGAGNKTLIRYSAELMQADLPAPADTADPRYDDEQKTLRFDAPTAQREAILAFYQDRLTKQGWKATTDKPIVDDKRRVTFVIFRNAAKDLLSLDLEQLNAVVRVELTHQTEAELAEEERLAKEHAEKERLAEAERNRKFKVALPVPGKAFEMEKLKENVYEFSMTAGSGPATLQQLRDHYVKDGWKEEEGTSLEKNTGSMTLKKEKLEVDLSYFDVGFGDMEVKVTGSYNVVFETVGKLAEKTQPKAGKKPGLPGLPELPPGVDLPPDVQKQLEDALKGVDPGWDLWHTGSLSTADFGDQFLIQLVSLNVAEVGSALVGWDPTQPQSWLIATSTNGAFSDLTGLAIDDSPFASFSKSERWLVWTSGGWCRQAAGAGNNQLFPTFSPVPESSTYAMLACAAGGGRLWRRRRVMATDPAQPVAT